MSVNYDNWLNGWLCASENKINQEMQESENAYPFSNEEDAMTTTEGWCLSFLEGSSIGDHWQIQKVDEADIFEKDQNAWEHIYAQARNGSELHIKALSFIKKHSPLEFKGTMEHIEKQ